MRPTFSDFFKSFYYSNTYVPAVDLSEQGVSRYLIGQEYPEAAIVTQRLISALEVQQVLSEPLTYDFAEVSRRNAILERYGFKLLSSKRDPATGQSGPFYSVIEHEDLPGWIIKSGASRGPKGQLLLGPANDRNERAFFTDEDALLRIEMANRVQKVAREANIEVVVPKKKLVAYSNLNGTTEPTRKYCVACEKIAILSATDTVQAIKDMDAKHQKEIARKISILVQQAGLVDASFQNIRLTRADGTLAFIDTEPIGLMVVKKSGLWNSFFGSKGASVEKCARIGLFTLMQHSMRCGLNLTAFCTEVESQYEKVATPKLSKWKIALSILSIGLIPLIAVILSLVKTNLAKRTYENLQKIDNMFLNQSGESSLGASSELECMWEEYQERRMPIAKQWYACIEGVPTTMKTGSNPLPGNGVISTSHAGSWPCRILSRVGSIWRCCLNRT